LKAKNVLRNKYFLRHHFIIFKDGAVDMSLLNFNFHKSYIHQSVSLLFALGLMGFSLAPCVFAETENSQPESSQPQSVYGCQQDKPSAEARKAFREKMKQELNLTPEQEEKMKALKEKNKPDWEQVRSKKQALKELKANNGDPEEIEALQNEFKALKTQLMEKHQAEMKNILTPEQQQKIEAHRAQHHKQKGNLDSGN
jgi:protein CpxP